MYILAVFPSPLSVARYGSAFTLPVNSASVWGRLRAVNMTVSNFVASTGIFPTKSTIRGPYEEADANDKQDVGRCVSLPDLKQTFLRSTRQRSALLLDADSTRVSET